MFIYQLFNLQLNVQTLLLNMLIQVLERVEASSRFFLFPIFLPYSETHVSKYVFFIGILVLFNFDDNPFYLKTHQKPKIFEKPFFAPIIQNLEIFHQILVAGNLRHHILYPDEAIKTFFIFQKFCFSTEAFFAFTDLPKGYT